jgi:hypothetical protein
VEGRDLEDTGMGEKIALESEEIRPKPNNKKR